MKTLDFILSISIFSISYLFGLIQFKVFNSIMSTIDEEWESPVNFDVEQVDIGLNADHDFSLESRSNLGYHDIEPLIDSLYLPASNLNPYFDYESIADSDSDDATTVAENDSEMIETEVQSVTTDGVDSVGHPVHVITRRRVWVPIRHPLALKPTILRFRDIAHPRDTFYFSQYSTDKVLLPYDKSDEKKELILKSRMSELYGGDDYFGLSDVSDSE